ncbi:MAG: hypothetical protein HFJ52_01970, partial [Clostridia bacterium]|nr:hypothetical protein [Clostridia bacterium]
YKVESYREEISHTVHSEIIAKSAIGETATTGDIADKLNNQDWIKMAYVNADATSEVGNITTQVVEGYVYQIYYNSIYGKIEIDYIGKDITPEDINGFTLTARYEKAVTSIFGAAEDKKKGIAKLELIYKDQVVGIHEKPKGEVSWDVEEIGTGWYKVKATSNSGAIKYEWVKVTNISDKLIPPEIVLTSEKAIGGGDWYVSPVTVEMKYNEETAKEVHYRILEEGIIKSEDIKYETSFTINNIFKTEIYAWTVDETGRYQSEEVSKEIKLDTKVPTVEEEIISAEPPVNDWYKGEVTIKIKGEDEGSGIKEYIYSKNEGTTWESKRMNEEIKITEEGTTNIQVKTKDIAGNESQTKTITIKKDTTPPEKPTIRQTSNTANSITVEAIANDNAGGSGIKQYKFEIKPISGTDSDWTSPTSATINSTAGTQSYTFTGLSMGEYSIRVTVKDKVSNQNISNTVACKTIINTAPIVETVTYASKTTNSITVRAKATDAQNDALTYTMYVSTNGSSWTQKAISGSISAGLTVTLTANGLAEYTNYYIKIRASETSTLQKFYNEKTNSIRIRTYCRSNFCEDAGKETVECTLCTGRGYIINYSSHHEWKYKNLEERTVILNKGHRMYCDFCRRGCRIER